MRKISRLEVFLFFLLFVASSWDIFANIKVSGYSVRFFYFVEMLLLFFLLFVKKRISLFIGHVFFVFWILFIVIAIPNTSILTRNVGYFFWLVFSYLLLILIVSYFQTIEKFFRYFKLYVFSFLCMSLFGFVQFVVGLAGISLMTTQWWIKGVIPRINGLSYEPSYYGTYISGGAALLYWLTFVEKRKILPFQLTITLFTILVIVLSSSRIAILSLIFVVSLHILYKFFIPLFKGKLNLTGLRVTTFFLTIILAIIIFIFTHLESFKIFMTGIGLFGSPSHSVDERLQAAIDTFKVFLNNPFIGVSLGGIPSHRANLYGITISTQLEAKQFEGLNVLLEVLAASGIVGFLFFLIFWFNLLKVHFSLEKKVKKTVGRIHDSSLICLLSINRALGVMLIVEFFALMMNQNILRPYFWLSLSFYISCLVILRKNVNYRFIQR